MRDLLPDSREVSVVFVRATPGPAFTEPVRLRDGLIVVPHWRDVTDARTQVRLRRCLGKDVQRTSMAILAYRTPARANPYAEAMRAERALALAVPDLASEYTVRVDGPYGSDGLVPHRWERLANVLRTAGWPARARVTTAQLEAVPSIIDATVHMRTLGRGPINRLARALHAYHRGLATNVIDERLHQFVRVLDGIAATKSGRGQVEFRERAGRILGLDDATHGAFLDHAFRLRSSTEHLRGPLQEAHAMLGEGHTDLDAYVELARVAFGFEEAARHALRVVLSDADLATHIADYEDARVFWDSEASVGCWGAPFDLHRRSAMFSPANAQKDIRLST